MTTTCISCAQYYMCLIVTQTMHNTWLFVPKLSVRQAQTIWNILEHAKFNLTVTASRYKVNTSASRN